MNTCQECAKPCPEHSALACATCHNHPGECGYGGCGEPHIGSVDYGTEVRHFCPIHLNDPAYGWLRAGGVTL